MKAHRSDFALSRFAIATFVYWTFAGLVLTLSFRAIAAETEPGSDQRYQDLELLESEWLPKNRSCSPAQLRNLKARLQSLRDQAKSISLHDFVLGVSRVVATCDNAHTLVSRGELASYFHRLPIRVWWFSGGLFITRAEKDYAHLLGAKVTAIENVAIDEMFRRIADLVPGNDQWKRYRSIEPLTELETLLNAVGKDTSQHSVVVALELANGNHHGITMRGQTHDDPLKPLPTWAESLAWSSGEWVSAMPSDASLPLYLQEPGENILRFVADHSAYIRINRTTDGDGDLSSQLYNFLFEVAEQPIDNVVVDVRYNHGGDFLETLGFLHGLLRLAEREDKRIYVLGGRATMSAAIVIVAILRTDGRDRVRFFGEPLGDRMRFWAEGGGVTLPNSGMTALYNDGFHDWRDGCQDSDDCFVPAYIYSRASGLLLPDRSMSVTYQDYVEQRDPVLEAVFADIAMDRTSNQRDRMNKNRDTASTPGSQQNGTE